MNRSDEVKIIRFAKTICGQYSNYLQAYSDSKNFAHINIFIRPLPFNIMNSPALYTEQSYSYNKWSPYKQSILNLKIKDSKILAENYGSNNCERIAGGGFKPELLSDIKKNQLYLKEGCCMSFTELQSGYYLGKLLNEGKCLLKNRDGMSYLKSNVAIYKDKWISIDEGYDIDTDKKIWGSQHGPFLFRKTNSLEIGTKIDWINSL